MGDKQESCTNKFYWCQYLLSLLSIFSSHGRVSDILVYICNVIEKKAKKGEKKNTNF